MCENNFFGSILVIMNSIKIMSIGIYKVFNVKSEDNCIESKFFIRFLVLKIIKRVIIMDINIIIFVLKRNILKILIVLVLLYLCIFIFFVLWFMVVIVINI